MTHKEASARRTSLQWMLTIIIIIFETQEVISNEMEYGPSLSTLTSIYATVKVDSKILSVDELSIPATVYLKDYSMHSVLIPLVKNKIASYAEEIFEERQTTKVKNFEIEAPEGFDGIIAVIQEIDLGSIEKNDSPHRCSNFIKFDDGKGSQTEEICGKATFFNYGNHPEGLFGPRSFISTSGKMIVSFKFGDINEFYKYNRYFKDFRQEESKLLYKLGLSFTAFKDCAQNNIKHLSPCEITTTKNATCINAELFCDGIYNCGIDSLNTFGSDELNCPFNPETEYRTFNPYNDITKNPNKLESFVNVPIEPDIGLSDQSSLYPTNPRKNDRVNREEIISPATTILLIVFTVFAVMFLATMIRFCCQKCAGTDEINPDLSNSASTIVGSVASINQDETGGGLGLTNVRINNQCSRVNYTLDMPPSYEDLFPSSKENSEAANSTINNGNTAEPTPESQDSLKVP